jgi:hypothetical protein
MVLWIAGAGTAEDRSPSGPAGIEDQSPSARTGTEDRSANAPLGAEDRLEVPPPPFSDGIFPCSGCHAGMEVNRTRRPLTDMHADIVLKHGDPNRWCLDCHDPVERDSLHLASGERIPFDESYRLCGQCHGEKYRDWKVGVHGRRTGNWNGHKQYLLCAHCHNPHQPRFRPLAPKPPPTRPARPRRGQ